MAGYDPQARRTRPSVIGDSPVDDLLGHLPLAPVGQAADGSDRRDPPVARAVPDALPAGEGPAVEVPTTGDGPAGQGTPPELISDRPFDTPPVEMTDENADRLQRLAVLGAVVTFVVMLSARRRRRRH